MSSRNLARRLKQLEASLTPAGQQGITLRIISAATGEIIDLESPNQLGEPPRCQSAGHSAPLRDTGSRHSVASDNLDLANRP